MPQFDKNHTKELKELLCTPYIHDARIKNIQYDHGEDCLRIEAFHPFFNVNLYFTFRYTGITLATKGTWHGSRETIIDLTVLEDFSYLQNCFPKCSEDIKDSLYLMFQMFSGDELHIVSREVSIDIVRQ